MHFCHLIPNLIWGTRLFNTKKLVEDLLIPAFFSKQGHKGESFKFFPLDFGSRLFGDFDHSLFASVSYRNY